MQGFKSGQARGLPTNPAKEKDTRYNWYVETTGETDSWELDVLSPPVIDGLIDNAIRGLIDHVAWGYTKESEELSRKRLRDIAGLT